MLSRIIGTLAGQGTSSTFCPTIGNSSSKKFNIWIMGTFTASFILERSWNNTDWVQLTNFGSVSAPGSFVVDEPEQGVIYRLRCVSHVSGTMNYRFSY